jgi:hypothetical protein
MGTFSINDNDYCFDIVDLSEQNFEYGPGSTSTVNLSSVLRVSRYFWISVNV